MTSRSVRPRTGSRRAAVVALSCAVIASLSLLVAKSVSAGDQIQLFGKAGLDETFCQQKTFRNTVVYIDDTIMREGQTGWAESLVDKLRATLTPGERVTTVQLSPTRGTSQQIWSACWPDFTAAKRDEISKQTYFFSGNPLESIKKQQSLFLSSLGSALTEIYVAARKPSGAAAIQADKAPRKQIIEALASDGARFSQSPVTIRAIVYSDLAETSDIGSVFDRKAALPAGVGQKLGTFFRRSVFYFYGVGCDVNGDPGYLEAARKFWTATFASMESTIEGFGSDLNVPNEIPVAAHRYVVMLTRDGEQLFGRASLLVDGDGNLIDSWIGVSRLTFVGITGTFHCSSSSGTGCALNATTEGGLATNSPAESIVLSGDEQRTLRGTIGVQGALTFPLIANAANE